MTGLLKQSACRGIVLLGVVALGWWPVLLQAEAAATPAPTAVADPSQLLEMGPVGQARQESPPPVSDELISPETGISPTGDQTPAMAVTPSPTPATMPSAISPKVIHAILLSPYYFSAYLPQTDRTELDLGLLLSQHPGLNVSLAWGATSAIMASARLAVQGASYTTGLGLLFAMRQEEYSEIKPALALSAQWRGQNFRTNDEARNTIYRGNRFNLGMVASKDLGGLAMSLGSDPAFVDFLHFFTVHVEALGEYQTGRIGVMEDGLSRVEFGVAGTLEITLAPRRIFLALTYQSLSDWLNEDDRYLAVRYYPRDDFSLDLVAGWLGPEAVLNLGLGWLF